MSVIGLGTWQLGADRGSVEESDALAVLSASVDAAVEFSELVADGVPPAAAALRRVIAQPGVTAVIPGARNVSQAQAQANAEAAALPAPTEDELAAIRSLYDRRIRPGVHQRW